MKLLLASTVTPPRRFAADIPFSYRLRSRKQCNASGALSLAASPQTYRLPSSDYIAGLDLCVQHEATGPSNLVTYVTSQWFSFALFQWWIMNSWAYWKKPVFELWRSRLLHSHYEQFIVATRGNVCNADCRRGNIKPAKSWRTWCPFRKIFF